MRIFKKLTLFAAGALLAASAYAAPAKPFKTFEFNPDNYCGKAGVSTKTQLTFKTNPGFKMAGFDVKILRKDAPKEFFAIPKLPYSKHRASDYDTFVINKYKAFPQWKTSGTEEITLDLRGYLEGDYSILVVGCFVNEKNQKRIYAGGYVYLSITESDQSVLPGNVKPAEKNIFNIQPPAAGAPAVFSGNFEFDSEQKVRLYSLYVLRKDAPAEFFKQNAAKVEKHKTNVGYDRITLQGNTALTPPSNVGTFQLKPSMPLVPGTYKPIVQLYGHDASKKPFYKSKSVTYIAK